MADEFLGPDVANGVLFPPMSSSTSPLGKVYPGLSNEALVEIIEFIHLHAPQLITLLSAGIERSLKSENKAARESAAIIHSGMSRLTGRHC